jgi:hypothetical protein
MFDYIGARKREYDEFERKLIVLPQQASDHSEQNVWSRVRFCDLKWGLFKLFFLLLPVKLLTITV